MPGDRTSQKQGQNGGLCQQGTYLVSLKAKVSSAFVFSSGAVRLLARKMGFSASEMLLGRKRGQQGDPTRLPKEE